MLKSTLLGTLACAFLHINSAVSEYTNLPQVEPGVFNASARMEIHNTTFDAAWNALTDFPKYPLWNPFVRYAVVTSPLNVTLPDQRPVEGKNLFFRVQIPSLPLPVDEDTPDNPLNTQLSQELIIAVQPELGRLAWEFYPATPLLSARRWQAITDLGDGTILYESREVFGGPAALAIQATLEEGLQQSFEGQAEGLKLYLEGQC